MPVGTRQKLITSIVSKVLEQEPELDRKFPWFINQHQKDHFQELHPLISRIYFDLKGNDIQKGTRQLQSDAYFGGRYNFLFEFDEVQHFSTARLTTLNQYPKSLKTNYSIDDWKNNCLEHSAKADKYRYNKTTVDFDFTGGRTHQRAYLDCFRDFLPLYNGLNPTLRISEFEVSAIEDDLNGYKLIKKLIERKLNFL